LRSGFLLFELLVGTGAGLLLSGVPTIPSEAGRSPSGASADKSSSVSALRCGNVAHNTGSSEPSLAWLSTAGTSERKTRE
jgi:hypothetical protein